MNKKVQVVIIFTILLLSTLLCFFIHNKKVKNPRIDTLIKIAEALELTNDEFAELCGYRKGDENGLSQQNCSKKQ